MEIDQPIFRSVQQALHFSFLMETLPVTRRSAMSQIYAQGGNRVWDEPREPSTIHFGGLSELDVRGQCAMVRGAVIDHLLLAERHAVHARYATQSTQADGVRAMRDAALPLMSCQSDVPTLEMAWLVFGCGSQTDGITTRSLADDCGMSQSSIVRDIIKIRRVHQTLMSAALDKLTELFRKDGLIER